jgi:hypothetical protein
MEMFLFGRVIERIDRHGESIQKGQFALHVQCPWHLERAGSIIIGSGDLYVPATLGDDGEGFDWGPSGSNRRDVTLKGFFSGTPSIVEEVEATAVGTLTILLTGDTRLRVFPDRSSAEREHWRFFELESGDPHLVLVSEGVTYA